MHIVPRPSSLHSVVPLDDLVLCYSIPDYSLFLKQEQSIDRVGVAQPTCIVIHE